LPARVVDTGPREGEWRLAKWLDLKRVEEGHRVELAVGKRSRHQISQADEEFIAPIVGRAWDRT
jgi:hypothetical protein